VAGYAVANEIGNVGSPYGDGGGKFAALAFGIPAGGIAGGVVTAWLTSK